jgi:hypothetical protein
MIRNFLFALVALALAACGGLEQATGIPDPFGTPQPFRGAGDQQIVTGVLGERAVYIGAIAGLAPADESALRKAIATNAAALDVLASADSVPLESLTLTGTAKPGAADFTLSDGAAPIATFSAAGDLSLIAVGAARALSETLGRLGSTPPGDPASPAPATAASGAAPPPPPKRTPAAYIKAITAPTAAQATPLRRAVSQSLANMGVRMSDAATAETYAITGALTLGPDEGGRTAISLIWTVYAPDGANLGEARQENALPTDSVRKTWAEQAALAGGAAARSVAEIIASHFNKKK